MPADPYANTFLDDASDDDRVSPAERAEALRLFKRGAWRGTPPAVLRTRYKDSFPTLYDRPVHTPELLAGEIAALAAIIISVGAAAGWVWRKNRQAEALGTNRSADLAGLDVILSRP